MQAAEGRAFDIVVAEAPDRISRDIADLAGIHKALEFRGIEMNCVNGGRMDTLQIGMYGVMGQMQREEGCQEGSSWHVRRRARWTKRRRQSVRL